MAVVWKKEPVPASAVARTLAKRRRWKLATVRTLLRRLVTKGALRQAMEGRRYLYTARVSREECARREGESLLDRFLGKLPSLVIVHLVNESELSREDIRELQRILTEKEE